MTVIKTAASLATSLVTALCLSFVALFIFLAYFEPMTLDALVHQAHEIIPQGIDATVNAIHNLF